MPLNPSRLPQKQMPRVKETKIFENTDESLMRPDNLLMKKNVVPFPHPVSKNKLSPYPFSSKKKSKLVKTKICSMLEPEDTYHDNYHTCRQRQDETNESKQCNANHNSNHEPSINFEEETNYEYLFNLIFATNDDARENHEDTRSKKQSLLSESFPSYPMAIQGKEESRKKSLPRSSASFMPHMRKSNVRIKSKEESILQKFEGTEAELSEAENEEICTHEIKRRPPKKLLRNSSTCLKSKPNYHTDNTDDQKIKDILVRHKEIEDNLIRLKEIEDKKIEEKKIEYKKIEDKKIEEKKIEYKKIEDKKIEDKKIEDKKIEDKKIEYKKIEDKKIEDKKIEDKKIEHKKIEDKKIEYKKIEDKKIEELPLKKSTENVPPRLPDEIQIITKKFERKSSANSVVELNRCISDDISYKTNTLVVEEETKPTTKNKCEIMYSWQDLENWVPPSQKKKLAESNKNPKNLKPDASTCKIKYSWQVIGIGAQTSDGLMEDFLLNEQIRQKEEIGAKNYPCTVKYSWQIIGTATQVSSSNCDLLECNNEYWKGNILTPRKRIQDCNDLKNRKCKIMYSEGTQTFAEKSDQTDTTDCRVKYSWQNLTKLYLTD